MKKTAIFIPLLLALLLSACAPKTPADTTSGQTTALTTTPDTTEVPPVENKYPLPKDYAFFLSEAQKLATDSDDPHYSLAGDSSDYAWGTSYLMQGLYTAYRVTKDMAYLDTYAKVCQNLLSTLADNDGDGFLGWGSGEYSGGQYEEFAVHAGLVTKGLADFILLVKSDPALATRPGPGGESFSVLAERVCAAVDNEIIPSFEKDFSAALGIYMNRPGSGNYSGATGAYSLPHNQYLAMTTALYTMALVSPEKSAFYLARADAQARVFRSFLRVKKDGFVNWNYDDPFHKGDHEKTTSEDYSHAMIDYQAAAEAYHRGLYTFEDMALFADNLTGNMFNGDWDNVKLAFRVSGGRWAEFTGEPLIYHILLSPFGEAVWPLCEAGFTGRISDAALLLAWHPDAPAPKDFLLTAPASNGQEVDPAAAVFCWTPSKNAADYTLEISETADFAVLSVSRPYIAAVGALVDTLKENTAYFWRVSARNACGETAQSETASFTTGPAAALAPKTLTFSYKMETDQQAEGRSMRVYLHKELVAEVPLVSGEWQEFSLDLTEEIGRAPTAGIKISLYSDHAEPAGEVIYLTDVAILGSESPKGDWDGQTFFMGGRPALYANRNGMGMADGVLKLRLPLFSEVKMFSQYAGTGKIINEAFADFGFTFAAE